MPEAINNVEKLRAAKLVSNPGCYATAAVMAVLPLLRAGFMESDSAIIDAKSGTTGAGRKANEEMSFSEVADDVHAYRIFRHQHAPENRDGPSFGRRAPRASDVHAPPASGTAGHFGYRVRTTTPRHRGQRSGRRRGKGAG